MTTTTHPQGPGKVAGTRLQAAGFRLQVAQMACLLKPEACSLKPAEDFVRGPGRTPRTAKGMEP